MSIIVYISLIILLSLIAFCASLLGIGGGSLYTPTQILFGIDIHNAAATSLFLIIILSIGATIIYRRSRKVDWQMALVFELFTAGGGFAGAYFSKYIPSLFLMTVLIIAVTISGILMLRKNRKPHPLLPEGHSWYHWQRKMGDIHYTVNIPLAFPICFLAGTVSGMVGVGGGFIKVPMMTLLFGIAIDIAIATSALMVGITAIGGFTGHLFAGHWDWKLSLILAPGIFIGAQLGAHSMLRFSKARLKKIFGIFMLLIAAGLVIKILVS